MGVEDPGSALIAGYKAVLHHPLRVTHIVQVLIIFHVPVDNTGVRAFSIKHGVRGIARNILRTQHKIDVRPKTDVTVMRTKWQKNDTIVVCDRTIQLDLVGGQDFSGFRIKCVTHPINRTSRIVRRNDRIRLARRRFRLGPVERQDFSGISGNGVAHPIDQTSGIITTNEARPVLVARPRLARGQRLPGQTTVLGLGLRRRRDVDHRLRRRAARRRDGGGGDDDARRAAPQLDGAQRKPAPRVALERARHQARSTSAAPRRR